MFTQFPTASSNALQHAACCCRAVVHKITAPLAPKASDSKPVPESPKVNLPDLSFPSGGALPTLFGKAMGSLVGMAVQAIGSQVRSALCLN